MKIISKDKKARRVKKVRSKAFGFSERPRLSVFRSNRFIYAQIIDDQKRMTLVAAASSELPKSNKKKTDLAREVGLNLAKKAIGKKIKKIVFDRGAYKFHGRVKALAQGAREGGLEF